MIGIHTSVLPNGQVLSWEGHNDDEHKPGMNMIMHAYTWDSGNQAYQEFGTMSNFFCTGHTFLADGRLLEVGGHYSGGVVDRGDPAVNDLTDPDYIPGTGDVNGYIGLRDANTFDFNGTTSSAWQMKPSMGYRRWYPTATTLPNGDVLAIAGQQYGGNSATNNNPVQATVPEVYEAATDSWRKLSGAARELPFYPWMFVAPDGRVFNAGPNLRTGFLDVAGTGAWTDFSPLHNSSGNLTSSAPSGIGYAFYNRFYGTAVLYEPGKILALGGAALPAVLLDLNASAPDWTLTAPMAYPARVHVNATLLADGSVLVTGGTPQESDEQHAVLPAELWTPPTRRTPGGSWTTMNAMAVPRLYHSTAVLLPDGRVLSTGGGEGGTYRNHPDYEIFSPPYLFTGTPRPVVAQVPAQVGYGQLFTVQTGAATRITQANLIGLSSVTHSFNMNQRFNPLSFTVTQGNKGLQLAAPTRAIDCPPGYYMLFLVDDHGVPSQASIIRIVAGQPTNCNLALSIDIQYEEQFVPNYCSIMANISVAATLPASTYRWTIDGTYNSSLDNLATINLPISANKPTRTVKVEAQPACGGAAVITTRTFTTYFPKCPTSSD